MLEPHLATEQESRALELFLSLDGKVAGMDVTADDSYLDDEGGDNSVRCFTSETCRVAQQLVIYINSHLVTPQFHVVDRSTEGQINHGEYEIWFAPGEIVPR